EHFPFRPIPKANRAIVAGAHNRLAISRDDDPCYIVSVSAFDRGSTKEFASCQIPSLYGSAVDDNEPAAVRNHIWHVSERHLTAFPIRRKVPNFEFASLRQKHSAAVRSQTTKVATIRRGQSGRIQQLTDSGVPHHPFSFSVGTVACSKDAL